MNHSPDFPPQSPIMDPILDPGHRRQSVSFNANTVSHQPLVQQNIGGPALSRGLVRKDTFRLRASAPPLRRTKIVCTAGPASKPKEVMGKLVNAGMNVMRMNFSHGTHEYHSEVMQNLREYLRESKKVCAILLDTKGPEIRTGKLKDGKPVNLSAGQEFTITTDSSLVGDETQVCCTYPSLTKSVDCGDEILLDDGLISLTVLKKDENSVLCQVNNNGELGETKGVNLPGSLVDLPAVTEKDKSDILFGVEQGVDFIAASFVRKASDVREIRSILGAKGRGIQIISKIENQEGVDNFDEILNESDGIMVARGDLGVEIPIEKIFLAQKVMIAKCNAVGKPVITATQMLESMIHNPRPTRAEVTDVANAVFDGTDCVMLSGETAKGSYPVEAVTVMNKVCAEAEAAINYKNLYSGIRAMNDDVAIVEAISSSAVKTCIDLGANLLIALTETGRTARLIAKYRPPCATLCITASEQTARQTMVSRGLYPLLVGSMFGTDAIIEKALKTAKDLKLCKRGDLAIVTSGMKEGVPGSTNVLKVVTVP
eukprot:GFYU01016576.1.p1 GENE.GFYU01016576.1~~GFYU01016576.1.p1  ORF type:complete len:542 (-),score=164.17 GFYU01016576.1:218-1843(-)